MEPLEERLMLAREALPGGAAIVDGSFATGASCTAPMQTHGVDGGGNVQVKANGRLLQVRGDSDANAIRIEADSDGRTLTISGLKGTEVNGKTGPVRFRRVRGLDIRMAGGNDAVFFGPDAAASGALDALLDDGLSVRMDTGDDVLNLCGLQLSGPTRIGAGLGADTYVIDDMDFRSLVTIGSGDSDDSILIETRGDANGPITFFRQQTTIRGKDGGDRIRIGRPGEPGNGVEFQGNTDVEGR